MDTQTLLLVVSFFFIALVYSSVGFGGGSSYLALLAVMGTSYELIRPTALLCNIVVVTGGTFLFIREKQLSFKTAWPFVVASIPAAFLGGLWRIQENTFFIVLGFTLVLASVFLWIKPGDSQKSQSTNIALNTGLGGGIGFLSGLVSIGGGIFLSPLLHLMSWGEAKKIAALASFFILVNSISGLAGQLAASANLDWKFILPLLAAVLFGGQIGSRLAVRYFNAIYIKRITAVLILVAGINILKDHL